METFGFGTRPCIVAAFYSGKNEKRKQNESIVFDEIVEYGG